MGFFLYSHAIEAFLYSYPFSWGLGFKRKEFLKYEAVVNFPFGALRTTNHFLIE